MAENAQQPEAEQEDNRLSTVVALLIAAVSVVGAIVAWRASVAGDGAGDADVAGIRATINLTETTALAAVESYGDYASYAEYLVQRELGRALERQIVELPADADETEFNDLKARLAETSDRTTAAAFAFPNQFLNRDGSYGLHRQQSEFYADVGREKDLKPDASFAEGDALRGKTDRLLIALSVLAMALVFYTLIEAVSQRTRYILLVLGSAFFLAGAVGALLIETGRL